MKKLFTILFLFVLLGKVSLAQSKIVIDGDMLDWEGIPAIDQGEGDEKTGDLGDPKYVNVDIKDIYVTHDKDNVYMRIDLADAADISKAYATGTYQYQIWLGTEMGDTLGLDYGWWNVPQNYVLDLSFALHPDSTNRVGIVWKFNGDRNGVNYAIEEVGKVTVAMNEARNAFELSFPRSIVNFGSEFRPFCWFVEGDWGTGADYAPTVMGGKYGYKYDFLSGGSTYVHNGPELVAPIVIDDNTTDWASISPADSGAISEETGDAPAGAEYDIKDFYVAGDSSNLYIRYDIPSTASFASMYANNNKPVVDLYFDVMIGDTTGLNRDGKWNLHPDYKIDLSEALNPANTSNKVPVQKYKGDNKGFKEVWANVDTATFAVNAGKNVVELSVSRSAINMDKDVRPFLYVSKNSSATEGDYFPNSILKKDNNTFAVLKYNTIDGASILKIGDSYLTSGVSEKKNDISAVQGFGLVSNYPNPFNPSTKISFTLPKSQRITVEVYNILGTKIATLVNNQEMPAGQKTITWEGRDNFGNVLSSGIYIYRISSSDYSASKKMMLLK